MTTHGNHEAELQRLLKLYGGDWESLARGLFNTDQATQVERKRNHKRLMRAFTAPKSLRVRGKELHTIFVMLDKINEHRKQRDTTKAVIARLATQFTNDGHWVPMRNVDRAEWEKVLAEHNGRVKKLRLAIPTLFRNDRGGSSNELGG